MKEKANDLFIVFIVLFYILFTQFKHMFFTLVTYMKNKNYSIIHNKNVKTYQGLILLYGLKIRRKKKKKMC